jgi:short-subunit dehydrogenase
MKKVILISGGNDGLGKALATLLAPTAEVVILGRNKERCEKVAQEINVHYVVADVRDHEQIARAVQEVKAQFGRVDCLVNNAGVWIEGLLEETSPESIEEALLVNTLGPILLTRAVIPLMKEQGGGRIINVNSQAGLHVKALRSVYHASKWGLRGFTDSIRMELSKSNISVSGFYPGAMKTSFFAKQGIEKKDMPHHMDLEDAAQALVFMINASDSLVISELGMKPMGI